MRHEFRRGFTLVEILIVVVIIGTLATLLLPRLTGQSERARVAEAVGFLSAMRRGQLAYFNEYSAYLELGDSGVAGNRTDADIINWRTLGLDIPPTGKYWDYQAIGGVPGDGAGEDPDAGQVIATRTNLNLPPGGAAGGQITLMPDGTWGGTGDYLPGGPYAPQG